METLFSGFAPVSADKWKEQLQKDLKGTDFATLIWKNINGFDILPFYTSEDLGHPADPLFSHYDWDICETILVKDALAANALALEALNGGASGLVFQLNKTVDLQVLLHEILVEHIYIQFVLSADLPAFQQQLNTYLNGRKPHLLGINYDPIAQLVNTGAWQQDEATDLNSANQLNQVCINADIYHNAGCTTVTELALTLAHANEYLNLRHTAGGLASLKNITAVMASGSDFFTEIAKLRALRKLWALLAQGYGQQLPLHVHSETSDLNKSLLDSYNNMLRTSTEGMSAVLGGCNSLVIKRYDNGFQARSAFSNRMARNQQIIFKEESYLNKVADAGSGSYYIEVLTDDLAAKAWERFQEIEQGGGLLAGLKNGTIQARIAAEAQAEQARMASGERILLGINKYPNGMESLEGKSLPETVPTKAQAIQPIPALRLAAKTEQEKLASLAK